MEIELINDVAFKDEGIIAQMQRVIDGAIAYAARLAELENEDFEVCLTLTDNQGIHALNREHRGVDAPTDVLSFPLLEFSDQDDCDESLDESFDYAEDDDCAYDSEELDPLEEYRNLQSGNIMLGDIVVNMDRAREQAESYGHSFEREACYLCVHSVLHLFGYDHMTDDEKEQMRALEEEIMNGFGIKR